MAPKSAAVAAAFALVGGLRGASGSADAEALIQQSVVRHREPSRPASTYALGQRVELEGYPIDMNFTVVGHGAGAERYNVLMDGNNVYKNVEGKFLKTWTTPFPASQDPQAGPIAHILDFDWKPSPTRPYIVGRGEKPGTWNVYIPGHGLVPNIDDASIIRERSWYKTTPGPTERHSRERTAAAVLSGSLPDAKKRGNKSWLTTPPPLPAEPAAQTPEAVALQQKQGSKAVPMEEPIPEDELIPEAAPAEAALPASAAKPTLTRKLVALNLQGKGLGMDLKVFKGEGSRQYREELLVVDSIAPGGPVAQWNARHPFTPLRVGDRILQVNGVGGNARKIGRDLGGRANQTASVKLLAEKPGMTLGEGVELLFTNVKRYAEKGPKEYMRETLPLGLGKVFINSKDTVRECRDISSALYCSKSKEKYGIACAGWSGEDCLSKEEASCERVQTEAVCGAAVEKLGITCAGWGGSSCLPTGAHPNLITDADACWHAERKLGIEVAGWGGSSCLARSAKCSEITLPGLCNNAEAKLGLSCLGWGGSSCLDNGAGAELISTESLCKKSMERFGIRSAGWSGSHCLAPQDLACGRITDPAICNHASERLSISCAGWGGSSCLDVGAAPHLITAAAICQRSQEALGIASGGWSGSSCLAAGPVTCGAITHPGVCNDAQGRLGLHCAGWSGKECLAPEEAKCNKIAVQGVCERASARLGLQCVWNGVECMPDAAAR